MTRIPRSLRVALAALTIIPLLGWGALELLVRAQPYPSARFDERGATSLEILDARGTTLWQSATAAGGKSQWAPLSEISPQLINAVLASEDHRFYEHVGVDPVGVVRALWLNSRGMHMAYGGSTVTRVLDPSIARDLPGKLRQTLAALRLERAADKPAILEQYLNRIYFGHGAWGAQAAAQFYFGKRAAQLSLAEASLLAVIPRNPTRYSPLHHRDQALQRRRHILSMMLERGDIAQHEMQTALAIDLPMRGGRGGRRAPHFVDHVLNGLPDTDTDTDAQAGQSRWQGRTVHSTLDLDLQQSLELATRRHLDAVGGRNVGQAGLVVIRHSDGAILAMVGSRDYFDEKGSGALNVMTTPRRPGSTLKPFVYALALEGGDSPATLAYDVVLPGEAKQSYTADVRQHGFARYRESLAGSYNLSAVHTLQKVGVQALLDRLRLAGVSSLDWADERYTESLAIGEAQFTVLQYAGAFAAFGNGGRPVRPRAIARTALPGDAAMEAGDPGAMPAVLSGSVAYQIFDILSDPDARRPMFGRNVPMNLPFKVALKTGTTRAYTDNLAFGTTREFTVGAWAGNFDGTPTQAVMSMQGAAPLVRAAFVALAARYGDPTAPDMPEGLFEQSVCPLSGKRPGPHCPHQKLELFTSHSRLHAADRCGFHVKRCGRTVVSFPPELQGWARAYGLLDESDCAEPNADGSDGHLAIVYPQSGARFRLDPHRDAAYQMPPLHALPAHGKQVQWSVDGQPVAAFHPRPGSHVVQARRGSQTDSVQITFE